MPRILFFAEAVSLAHVARPAALAASLGDDWEIDIAAADRFDVCFAGKDWRRHRIDSITPAVFMRRLAQGTALYRREELEAYVEEDSRLMRAVRPDMVVGDFRLSLGVSARISGIPYLAIGNAHWSPWADIGSFPLPDITLARVLGPSLAQPVFRWFLGPAFRLHAAPLNAVRRSYGLAAYADVRSAYCDGDLMLYADTPGLVPTRDLPDRHQYIGPIVWSPTLPQPEWWNQLPGTRLVYVTLGSTGRTELLPNALACLEEAGFATLVATAGRVDIRAIPGRRFVAPFLPGEAAAGKSDFVVCNGGSATAYQALSVGKPVLGLCSNLDQFLTMDCIARIGAGLGLRAGNAGFGELRDALRRLRDDPTYSERARRIEAEFRDYPYRALFPAAARSAAVSE